MQIRLNGASNLFHDAGSENADVIDGTVVVVGESLLDALDDVETFGDFAKHGVEAVELGSTAILEVETRGLFLCWLYEKERKGTTSRTLSRQSVPSRLGT